MATPINNPQWIELQQLVVDGGLNYDRKSDTFRPVPGDINKLNYILAKYSRTIAAPELVKHIAYMIGQYEAVEVDAAKGYWSYLLGQHGIPCTAYARGPLVGQPRSAWPGVRMVKQDNPRRFLSGHEQDALLILNTLHPYEEIVKSLRWYRGRRIIVSLQDAPEHPPRLRELLDSEWVEHDRFKGTCRAMEPRTVYAFDRKYWANQPTRAYPIVRVD